MAKNQAVQGWLMQISPTPKGLAAHPDWQNRPRQILIHTKQERDHQVKQARAAMHRGELSAFRCDPI